MTRWTQVKAWRDRLRAAELSSVRHDLSKQGLRNGLHAALDALHDDALDRAAQLPGRPWPRAAVVMAGTVPTACIEWVALLLGRGSQVVIKHPTGRPTLTPLLCALADDLPLTATDDRRAILDCDVIIAMGSDASVRAIRDAARPTTTVFAHGHAWSCAWITGADLGDDPFVPTGSQAPWAAVASDACMYDGRGCLSPALIFTPLPASDAIASLVPAMQSADQRWPAGLIHPSERALIRARRALVRVVGTLHESDDYSIHCLPPQHAKPVSLPRSLCVINVPDLRSAVRCAKAWGAHLSSVGTDDPSSAQRWFDAGATRICRVGRMQRPPIFRVHDGTRWVHQTYRATGVELPGLEC